MHLYLVGSDTLITPKNATIMKNYLNPEIEIFDIVAERGYGDSVGLSGFGTEQDELVY